MIVKLKDIATEYSASVYQKYNVSNNGPYQYKYLYWKFPLPKFFTTSVYGLEEGEAWLIEPYKIEVLEGNTAFDISIENGYVVVRPTPASIIYVYVGAPALNDSNNPMRYIKYYFELGNDKLSKTCAEMALDETSYHWFNPFVDGFMLD